MSEKEVTQTSLPICEQCENIEQNDVKTVENVAPIAEDNNENIAENLEQSAEENAEKTLKNSEKTPKKQQKNKKKIKLNDVAKCTLVLVAIAVVAGLLLGLINWVTYVDPDGEISEKCTAYYSATSVEKKDDFAVSYDKNNYVKSCFVAYGESGEAFGYCYYAVGGGAKDGSIELLVYIGSDGVIDEISVYEQGETAGYFDKVEKANKSKYIGLDIGKIEKLELLSSSQTATKDGEISAVSQATYTSTGYHNAIASAVYAYHKVLGGER